MRSVTKIWTRNSRRESKCHNEGARKENKKTRSLMQRKRRKINWRFVFAKVIKTARTNTRTLRERKRVSECVCVFGCSPRRHGLIILGGFYCFLGNWLFLSHEFLQIPLFIFIFFFLVYTISLDPDAKSFTTQPRFILHNGFDSA